MTFLKRRALPALIPPEQFPKGFCLGKYYGFAAQVMYHCVLATCFLATIVWRDSLSLYHLATLAEPAYCTFDVLLLLCTGVSFTHWDWTPLLVHHVISCACTHALMYGLPCSVYGNLLQLTFHSSSAVCLGIANALVTPSLGVGAWGRLLLQLAALAFWTVTRVGLVLILGVCILLDAQQVLDPQRWRVTAELVAAAIGSFLFVVIKTPVITGALKEAIREYQETLSPAAVEIGAVEREPSFAMHEQVLSWGGRSC